MIVTILLVVALIMITFILILVIAIMVINSSSNGALQGLCGFWNKAWFSGMSCCRQAADSAKQMAKTRLSLVSTQKALCEFPKICRGPQCSPLNSRILIIRNKVPQTFGNSLATAVQRPRQAFDLLLQRVHISY